MRTRLLVVLVLLTTLLAPGAAQAGDLSRTPVQHASPMPWSLTQLWADMVSHLTALWPADSTNTPPEPSAPAGGGATTDGSGCADPNGQPRCGS